MTDRLNKAFELAAADALERINPKAGERVLVSGYRLEDFVSALSAHGVTDVVLHDRVKDGPLKERIGSLNGTFDHLVSAWHPAMSEDFLCLDGHVFGRVLNRNAHVQFIYSHPYTPKKILNLFKKALRKEGSGAKFRKPLLPVNKPTGVRRWIAVLGLDDQRAYSDVMKFPYTEFAPLWKDFLALGGEGLLQGMTLGTRTAVEAQVRKTVEKRTLKKPFVVGYEYLVGMGIWRGK
jgi:hypothetical protein